MPSDERTFCWICEYLQLMQRNHVKVWSSVNPAWWFTNDMSLSVNDSTFQFQFFCRIDSRLTSLIFLVKNFRQSKRGGRHHFHAEQLPPLSGFGGEKKLQTLAFVTHTAPCSVWWQWTYAARLIKSISR